MGYRVMIVMPCNMSEERKQMMRLFGAEVIETDAGDFDGAIGMRDKICSQDSLTLTSSITRQYNMPL